MDKKLLKLCILGCAAIAFNACNTGDYNNLDCDESYVAECLSENALMYCNSGKLDVRYCPEGLLCLHVDGEATCASDEPGNVTPVCNDSCSDTTHLNKCNPDGTTSPVDCSLDNNKVCGNDTNGKPACIEATKTCTPACDGVTLISCDGNNEVRKDCSKNEAGEASGLICGKNTNDEFACVEDSKTCEVSCDADGIHLNSCNDEGQQEVIDCSTQEDGKICGAKDDSFACIDKCTVADNKCDAETETAFVCDTASGKITEIVCPDNDGKICELDSDGVPGCVAKCSDADNKCSDDAMKLLTCNATSGHLEEVVCATEEHRNYQCFVKEGIAACDAKASIIGLPCTCEGEDCNSVLSGAQIKNLFTENGKTLLSEGDDNYFDSISDSDEIVVPNFFALGIKGCEALTAPPAGMKVACYRKTELTFAPSIVDIFANQFPAILAKYSSEEDDPSHSSENLSKFKTELGAILEAGIKFNAADVGYCTYAALNLKIDTSNGGLLGYMLEPNAFNADEANGEAGIAAKFNQGTVAGSAADSNDTCPAGSSYFRYNLNKSFSFIGDSTVAFSMCLQDCATNDDCNNGFECIDMNGRYCESDTDANCFDGHVSSEGVFFTSDYYNAGRVFPAPDATGEHKVCFSKEALGGFLALKGKLNQVKAGLKEAVGAGDELFIRTNT